MYKPILLFLLVMLTFIPVGSAGISYDIGTDTIIVTGYTLANPCEFVDLYNADVAGAWGRITKQGATQYDINCLIVIGDGSTTTYFADVEKQVVFTKVSPNPQFIKVRANANFRIGEIINATRKTSWRGCTITGVAQAGSDHIIRGYTGEYTGKIEIYSSLIQDFGTTSGCAILGGNGNFYVWNTRLSGININMLRAISSCELYNIELTKGRHECGIQWTKEISTFDKIIVTESFNGVFGAGSVSLGDYTINNLFGRGCPYTAYFWGAQPDDGYLINPDVDTWAFRWSTATGKIYRQYEFDLKIVDEDGNFISDSDIDIRDKNGNIIYLGKCVNGTLSTQVLNYGYYHRAGANVPVMETPHTFKITKDGFEPYAVTYIIDKKQDLVIKLTSEPIPLDLLCVFIGTFIFAMLKRRNL